jgi:hypothetical protein
MYPKSPNLYEHAYNRLIKYRALAYNMSIDEAAIDIRNTIIEQLNSDKEFKDKLNGMMMRNSIPLSTRIQEDVMQEVAYQFCKSSPKMLMDLHCDSYRRIFGLAVTIATRAGFGKMSKDIHQNASVAKQLTFKSNLNQKSHLSNTEDEIIIDDKSHKLPIANIDDDLWGYIRSKLSADEEQFLDFVLEKVLIKKYRDTYPVKLRKEYYSLTEYKILRLSLQAKIKKIIKDKNDDL